MRAVFVGRFQPFHNGHLYALKRIAKKYNEIFVVVGSANKSFTTENPFTFAERARMLRIVAREEGIKITIVPIKDVESDELWLESILKRIKKINAVFSNNDWVKRIFKQAEYEVKGTGRYDRGVNEGTYIRKLMAEGMGWQKYVPAAVAHYIKKIKGEERVKKLFLK
ncbi:MAG: nicotinamide-nucleotide adenylyltransferase [Candidatus Anstonellales archaeon]